MSILNIHVADDHALIGVDTQVDADGYLGGNASKLLVLPHANLVLAARGDIKFFGQVFTSLNEAMPADYDAAAFGFGDLLGQTHSLYAALMEMQRKDLQGSEIAIVGYSAREGRMMGVRYERWNDDKTFKAVPIDPWSMSPGAWPGAPDVPGAPDDAAKMEAFARDQVKFLRGVSATAAVGGRLLLAELTRSSLSIRTIADLEVSAEAAA